MYKELFNAIWPTLVGSFIGVAVYYIGFMLYSKIKERRFKANRRKMLLGLLDLLDEMSRVIQEEKARREQTEGDDDTQ